MLVSAIRHYGSAVGIHVFPLSGAPSHLPPHPTPLACQRPSLSSLSHTANSHWLFYFTYVSVYVSMLPFLTGCLFLENSSRHFLHRTPFILLNLRVSKGRGTCWLPGCAPRVTWRAFTMSRTPVLQRSFRIRISGHGMTALKILKSPLTWQDSTLVRNTV